MSFSKPSTEYWNRKLQAYLHDPFDKVIHIPGHETRASELLEILGEQTDNVQFWKEADILASGIERGTVPGYKKDNLKSGAVDFSKSPVITHPTGTENILKFDIGLDSKEEIINELKSGLEKFIGMIGGGGGYSDEFKGDPDSFAIARFYYLHLVLRFKLAENDNSKLGQLWHRIPADSRFPDHSIWNHNQLVSALNSCMDFVSESAETGYEQERRNNIGLSVFSISPVQGFIGKSRKLRDYWSSSIILSYLAFEGIKWVVENLGPDHILYPSLIDQPLFAEYMKKGWRLKEKHIPLLWKKHPKNIATFPNKFLFLAPVNKQNEIIESIKKHIKTEWENIVEKTKEYTKQKLELQDSDFYDSLWERQAKHFWEFSSEIVKLADLGDKDEILKLFLKDDVQESIETAEIFKKLYRSSKDPMLYGISHSLVQKTLASGKMVKKILREPEPGEKCQLCGEFEVLHAEDHRDKSAKEYSRHLKDVWKKINDESGETDFKENERLCTICTIKRTLPLIIKNNKDHILNSVFGKDSSFPSTTEIAIQNSKIEGDIKKIAQKLYNSKEVEGIGERDKYYAVLMMDGDKMGDLINGKTIGARWRSIIHPDLRDKIEGKNEFNKDMIEEWKKLFDKKVRNLIPSVHASISESLGDFAIYGVAPIINKYNGKLIYAGGDDVAAVMSLDNVLNTAQEIKNYYIKAFRSIGTDGKTDDDIKTNKPGKLSVGLGNSDGISISASILICHHKEPLSQMIARGHELLDKKAKNELGRNACAIELKKRSGGSRYYSVKWSEKDKWDAFSNFGNHVKKEESVSISTSLIYRLEKFRSGIEAILEQENWSDLLEKFLQKHLERSGSGEEINKLEMSKVIKNICVYEKDNERFFKPERLIVAAFLSNGGE